MSDANTLTHVYQRLSIVCLCLIGAGLGGCATHITNDQLAKTHPHTPVKLLVIESPMHIETSRLQTVFAPKNKHKLSLSAQPIAQAVTHSQHYALAKIDSALGKQTRLMIITPTASAKPLIKQLAKTKFDSVINQDSAKQLQTSTGADAVLRFGITDYGLTPKAWRTSYITFEVVSTLAITAIIASVGTTVAKGAAGAYLAQETVEETAEGYAGFWALDVVYRPVRIEAELIQLDPPAVVWRDDDTGLSDVKLSRLFRKVSDRERDMQLDQSTDYAVDDLVSSLSDKLSGKTNLHLPAKLKWEM